MESQRQVLDKNPIIKLKVLDMTSTSNTTVAFQLEEKLDFLQLDKFTGQLWFKQSSWKGNSTVAYSFVVTAQRSDGASARMTVDLTLAPFQNVKEFCTEFLCFYESMTYHAIEDFDENFKPREIGELSPKIFNRICKNFDINYELLNGKTFQHSNVH